MNLTQTYVKNLTTLAMIIENIPSQSIIDKLMKIPLRGFQLFFIMIVWVLYKTVVE